MNISVISSTLYPASEEVYGSEHMAAVLADELAKNHDVTLYAAKGTPEERYTLREIPLTNGIANNTISRYLIKKYKSDILDSDYIIDMSATLGTTEDIYWYYYDEFEGVIVWFRNGTSASYPRLDVRQSVNGVCLSKAAKQYIAEHYNVPEDNLYYIYYGIDTELYCPNYGGDYIAYTGAPRKDKGIFTILDIAEKCPEEEFRLGWHAVAEDHEKTEEEFIDEMNSRNLNNVELERWPKKTLEFQLKLYKRAKAFLQPTNEDYIEAFGLTTTEALSCGTPVIRETWGSSPEIMEDGVHGFLCEDLDEYVEAINNIDVINPRDCRSLVEQRFNKQRYANDYLDLYKELV